MKKKWKKVGKKKMNNVKHPCQSCVYFKVCGESTRTVPCNGRMTKTDRKKVKKDGK